MTLAEFKEGMQYDTHGNITGITRRGNISSGSYGLMDNLTLSYDGNRLTGVTEASADYDFAGSFEYKRANGLTRNRFVKDIETKRTTYIAEISLLDQSGFSSKTWNVNDGSDDWSVSFSYNFIP